MAEPASIRQRHWIREALSPDEDKAKSFDPRSWAAPDDAIADDNALWRQYLVFVDLYKFYLDTAWKASIWAYAVTGLVLVYFFDHIGSVERIYLQLLLLFLAVVCLSFSFIYFNAVRLLVELKALIEFCATGLKLPGRAHVEFAAAFVLFNASMLALTAVAVLILALIVA